MFGLRAPEIHDRVTLETESQKACSCLEMNNKKKQLLDRRTRAPAVFQCSMTPHPISGIAAALARTAALVALFALALAGCSNQAGLDAAAHAAADQMQRNAAIGALVQNYDQARAAQQWDLALSYADKLQRMAPDSVFAHAVQATLVDTNIHADQVRDKRRLAALWTYNIHPTTIDDDGVLISASIDSDNISESEDSAPARLVLRRHPKWGRSVYLVLEHGQFDCVPGCSVRVQFDDQPARSFVARKSNQNSQMLSIDDEKTIREILDKIRVITIDTSVDGQPRSLSFKVGGFDRVAFERRMQ